MIWSSFENDKKAFSLCNFEKEVQKDYKLKGSFQEDFATICASHNIVPCPYIICGKSDKNNDNSSEFIRISNCKIDCCSMRALILAFNAPGSKISEIIFHNCELENSNIIDLSIALVKLGFILTLKFEYMNLEGLEVGLKNLLLNPAISFEYLSFRGSSVNHAIVQLLSRFLSLNFTVKYLNLSQTRLNDDFIIELLKSLRLNPSLSRLSVSNNSITGSFIKHLPPLLLGTNASADDITFLKGVTKKIGDYNKNIKYLNKMRKKFNLSSFEEVNSYDPIIKDSTGSMTIKNNVLKCINISDCDIVEVDGSIIINSILDEIVLDFKEKLDSNFTLIATGTKIKLLQTKFDNDLDKFKVDL